MPIDPAKLNSLLDEQDGTQARQASLGVSVSPDDMGRALSIAGKRQQPPMVVAQNLPDFDEREHLDAVQDATRKSPMLGRWFQKPEHAALAKDDLPALSGIARIAPLLQSPVFGPLSLAVPILRAVQRGTRDANIGHALNIGNLSQVASTGQAAGELLDMPSQALRPLFGAKYDPLGTQQFAREAAGVSREANAELQATAIPRPSIAQAKQHPLDALSQAVSHYVQQAAQSAPSTIAALATRNPELGSIIMGAPSGAQTYSQLREQGVPLDKAIPASLGTGALEVAGERLGLEALLAPWRKAVITGPATEFGEEFVTQLGQQNVQDQATGQRTPVLTQLADAVDAGVTGATMGGSVVLARTLGLVAKSADESQQLGDLTRTAAEGKTGKRAPAAVEALVGDAGTVYVPAEAVRTLYQGSDPHAFVASLTGDADALNIAGQHGDIAIPLAKWASVIAQQPNAEEWVKHARTDPEGYSRADLESIDLDAELQSQPQEQASTEGADKIREDVLGQLLASDRYSPEDAELQASLVAKTFATLAQRSGSDPLELYQRYNLRVNGKPESLLQKATGKARALLQSVVGKPAQHETPEFKRWFGDSKVVDADGKPLVVYHGTGGNFDAFDNANAPAGMDKNRSGVAWFSDAPEVASEFAGHQDGSVVGGTKLGNSNVMPVYLSIKNPYIDTRGKYARGGGLKQEQVAELEADGYDGIIWPESPFDLPDTTMDGPVTGYFRNRNGEVFGNDVPYPSQYAVFHPEQIKSATGNHGTFDPANPSILHQPADGGAPRGQLRIGADRSMSIDLLKGADLSTFLHETGHLALEVFGDLAKSKSADTQLKADFDTLREWFGNTGEPITTEQHEAFAEAFEQYLLEGKAPAPDLQSAFSRFRAWLLSIYRNMVKMRVPLTDEVRSVFDRIIATDEEIQAAQQAQGMGTLELTDEAKALLTPGQWETYIAATVDATEEAKRDVLQRLMASHKRAAERWYRDERAKVKAEIESEVELAPTVRAWRILAGAKSVAGVETPEALRNLKLDPEQVLPDDRKAIAGMGVTKHGGVSPETAAALLGFDSGDALVQALKGVRDLQAQVEMETDARMEQRHPDAIASVADEALDAVHRNKRVQVLEAELTMLARLANKQRPNHRALRVVAERTIAAKAIRKLRPNDYLVAERKAANAAAKAAAKGDYAEALQAKRDQAMQSALYSVARRAQARAESQSRALRKAGTDKTRKRVGKSGKSYVEALDALLSTHELRRVSGVTVRRRDALRAWVAKRQESGDNTAVSDDLLARVEAERVTNIEDLTVKELGDLHEAVRNLLHLARVKNRLQTSAGQVSWKKAKALLIERLEAQPGKHGGGIGPADLAALDKLREFGGAVGNWVLQPETIVEWLDGGVSGPFHDLLWEPSEAAEHKREALQRMVGAKLKAAFDALPKADRKALDDKVYIRSLGESVSGHSILSALLNMGNASNRDKLLRGGRVSGDGIVPFTPEQLGEMFSHLTAAQANLAQGIWDGVNSLWPEIVAMEESLNGIAPAKVEPLPVTITTKDGPVSLRGGYFPAKYDPRGAKAGRFSEDEQAKRVLSGQIPVKASTSKGHLEKRTEYTAPLLLDYHAVLSQHLDGVMSDIAYRGFLKQAYRVLDDADLARRVENRLGHSALKALKAGFERGAVGSFSLAGPLWGPFQGVADATMTNVSSAALGLRVPLALANTVTAPILATARVQKRHLIAAFGSYYRDMRGSQAMIHALSPMMVRRSEARTIELQSILANLRGKSGARKQMIELAMSVHQWIVPLAENWIWMAAYRQAQAGGADITESVRLADKAIRQTQTKHTAKDLSQAEGNPYLRWAMMFAGPMVVINNRLQESGLRGKFRGAVHTPVDALGAWIAMAAGGSLVFELIMGRGPGDDDKDGDEDAADWIRWCARKVALLPFSAYPVLREAADKLDHGYVRANPFVEAANSLLQFGKTAIASGEALFTGEDVDEARLAKDATKAVGVATGIPTNQLVRSGTYLMEVGTGQHTPKNPAQEAAYLMQGPPKD